MARLDQDKSQTPKVPGVNIAGDYSVRGTDVAPEGLSENAYNGEAEALEAMETVAPSDQIHLSPSDADHMREQREKVKRETLKASAQTQSTLGGTAGAGANWPVDE